MGGRGWDSGRGDRRELGEERGEGAELSQGPLSSALLHEQMRECPGGQTSVVISGESAHLAGAWRVASTVCVCVCVRACVRVHVPCVYCARVCACACTLSVCAVCVCVGCVCAVCVLCVCV